MPLTDFQAGIARLLSQNRTPDRPEDVARLQLREQPNLVELKREWLQALDDAEAFIQSRPPEELGCLYYSLERGAFVGTIEEARQAVPHYGRPGGVLPQVSSD